VKSFIKTYFTYNQLRNFTFQLIITLSGESALLTFANNNKFRLICITAEVRGIFEYLDFLSRILLFLPLLLFLLLVKPHLYYYYH